MRSPTAPIEPPIQTEQEQRAAMMRRLGIVDDTPPPPEPAPRRLTVVSSEVEAPASYEQQLEDMLSRFGIEDRPAARPAPPPRREEPALVRTAPPSARVAEFDIPATPLRQPAPPPAPEPVAVVAEPPAPPLAKPTQDEMLQELRRQLKGRTASTRGLPVAQIAIPTPTKAQRRRAMGEMGYTKLVIWLVVIAVCGWLTYTVVKASVEHDQATAIQARR